MAVIFKDTFTGGTAGSVLNGRTPDVGNTYTAGTATLSGTSFALKPSASSFGSGVSPTGVPLTPFEFIAKIVPSGNSSAYSTSFSHRAIFEIRDATLTEQVVIWLRLNATTQKVYAKWTFISGVGGVAEEYEIGTGFSDGDLYTLRITYDGTTAKFYNDTTLLSSVTKTLTIAQTNIRLLIDGASSTTNAFRIDEIEIKDLEVSSTVTEVISINAALSVTKAASFAINAQLEETEIFYNSAVHFIDSILSDGSGTLIIPIPPSYGAGINNEPSLPGVGDHYHLHPGISPDIFAEAQVNFSFGEEGRGVVEFDLSSITSPPSAVMLSFKLNRYWDVFYTAEPFIGSVELLAYEGDNLVTLSDYQIDTIGSIGIINVGMMALGDRVMFNVTEYVSQVVGGSFGIKFVPITASPEFTAVTFDEFELIYSIQEENPNQAPFYYLNKDPEEVSPYAIYLTDYTDLDSVNWKHIKSIDSIGDYGNNAVTMSWDKTSVYGEWSSLGVKYQTNADEAFRWHNLGHARRAAFRMQFSGDSQIVHDAIEVSYNIKTQ